MYESIRFTLNTIRNNNVLIKNKGLKSRAVSLVSLVFRAFLIKIFFQPGNFYNFAEPRFLNLYSWFQPWVMDPGRFYPDPDATSEKKSEKNLYFF